MSQLQFSNLRSVRNADAVRNAEKIDLQFLGKKINYLVLMIHEKGRIWKGIYTFSLMMHGTIYTEFYIYRICSQLCFSQVFLKFFSMFFNIQIALPNNSNQNFVFRRAKLIAKLTYHKTQISNTDTDTLIITKLKSQTQILNIHTIFPSITTQTILLLNTI